jgi:hypothetical protein
MNMCVNCGVRPSVGWVTQASYGFDGDDLCDECQCKCGVSEPDYFGNRDLIESRSCPLHGTAQGGGEAA